MALLLRPRFLIAHLLVVAIAVTFVSLGLWQLRRHAEVAQRNERIAEVIDDPPVPVEEALADGAPELAMVTARGTWREDSDVSLTPRSRGGLPGFDVLTVLDTPADLSVLVDRGWVPLDGTAPPPPDGPVTITGRLRAAEEARQVLRDGDDVTALGAVSPASLVDQVPDLRTDVWIELVDEQARLARTLPRPADPTVALDGGAHLSYAFQWFAFTLIGLVGYPLLLRRRLAGQDAGAVDPARPAHPDGAADDPQALASPRS